jgi:hypothetical protein
VAKIVLGTAGALLGFFSDYLRGWDLPAGMACAAIVVPTFKYRRYWHARWFWSVIAGVLIIQVPLLILVRPLMERLKFGFNLLFVSLDAMLLIFIVNWVRPKDETDA